MVGFFSNEFCGVFSSFERFRRCFSTDTDDVFFFESNDASEVYYVISRGIVNKKYVRAEDIDLDKLISAFDSIIYYTEMMLPVGYKNILEFNCADHCYEIVPRRVVDDDGRLIDKNIVNKLFQGYGVDLKE